MTYKNRKTVLTFAIAAAAVFCFAACEKTLVPVTGSAGLSPNPSATAIPSPTPITSVEINKETAEITVANSNEASTVTIRLKESTTLANGKTVNADALIEEISKALKDEYINANSFRTPDELKNYSILCNEVPVSGLKAYVFGLPDEEIKDMVELFATIDLDPSVDPDAPALQFYTNAYEKAWEDAAKAIIYNCITNYSEYADQGYMGAYTKQDLKNEKLHVAYAMAMWGFGEFKEGTKEFLNTRGQSFDTAAGTYPEIKDFVDEVKYLYSNDAKEFYQEEVSESDTVSLTERASGYFALEYASTINQFVTLVDSISGITKVDDLTIQIALEALLTEDAYKVFNFVIK